MAVMPSAGGTFAGQDGFCGPSGEFAPDHDRTAVEVRVVEGATRTPSVRVRHVVLQEAVDHHYPVHFAGVSIVLRRLVIGSAPLPPPPGPRAIGGEFRVR